MKKLCIIGHFGFAENMLNGQTIKTKSITSELERQLGVNNVLKIDTHGGISQIPKIFIKTIVAFAQCKNIIILPAQNGLRLFTPLCVALNKIFHRRLHYIVIGGWLNDFLFEYKGLERKLKKFSAIYVETDAMKKLLKKKEFENVVVMPNFKNIRIIRDNELIYTDVDPYRLCTFSRVMKEKGIEEAIEAVKEVNSRFNKNMFMLDIFGQIDNEQIEWFKTLEQAFPEFISYKGLVPFDMSSEILKSYYALLFPTYYEGEGFAGTLIDAMASGVPVIASDWKYNDEIIVTGKTGILIRPRDNMALVEALMKIVNNSEWWNTLKVNCLEKATEYAPDLAIKCLMDKLD